MKPLSNETERIEVRESSDIVTARSRGRSLALSLGFSQVECTRIAAAISELARNVVTYAGRGIVTLRVVAGGDESTGLEVVVQDAGPGIAEVGLAMQDGYTSGNGLGLGLPGAKRLMDEFALESEIGAGTTVRATKWLNGQNGHGERATLWPHRNAKGTANDRHG